MRLGVQVVARIVARCCYTVFVIEFVLGHLLEFQGLTMASFIHTAPEHLVQKLCQCDLASGKEVIALAIFSDGHETKMVWRFPKKGRKDREHEGKFRSAVLSERRLCGYFTIG